jgi:hypothetical protein
VNLLLPSALLLLGLVGLPVLAHLTRQAPTERVPYGAMLLVRRLVKRLRRRRQLKDPLIFALRVLAVVAAVLAAAGPRYSYQADIPEFGGSGRVVVVIDRSMSMMQQDAGATLLQRARDEAAARVRALPGGALVGLVTFADGAVVRTPELTEDTSYVASMIDGVEGELRPGDLRSALLEARRLLAGEPGEVLLFSDEAGPTMIPAALEELERLVATGSAVLPVPIHADPPRNVSVTSAVYGDGIEGGQVVVRVTNFGPDPMEVPCEVELPDGAKIPVFVDLPPDGQAEARVTVPREAAGGVGHVHCEDPDLVVDDRRYFHLPRVGASRVLVVDGDPGDTPVSSEVYFLERALAPWGGLKSGVSVDVISPVGLSRLDPSVHRVVFLANVSDPRPFGARLRSFVRQGGAVVIAGGSNVTAERYNAAFAGVLPSPIRDVRALAAREEEPVPLKLPDVAHPLFEPFRRSGAGTLRRIGSRRVLTLEPYSEGGEVSTLLRYEGDVPAMIERQVGSGRVILWTSTFDFDWSNLPLQASFMPLVQRLVTYLGGESSGQVRRRQGLVGAKVELPLAEGVLDGEVITANGELVRSRIEAGQVVFTPEKPGGYAVRTPGGPVMAWVAVNLDEAESDVRRTHSVAATEAELEPELFVRHIPLSAQALGLSLLAAMLSAGLAMREETT